MTTCSQKIHLDLKHICYFNEKQLHMAITKRDLTIQKIPINYDGLKLRDTQSSWKISGKVQTSKFFSAQQTQSN